MVRRGISNKDSTNDQLKQTNMTSLVLNQKPSQNGNKVMKNQPAHKSIEAENYFLENKDNLSGLNLRGSKMSHNCIGDASDQLNLEKLRLNSISPVPNLLDRDEQHQQQFSYHLGQQPQNDCYSIIAPMRALKKSDYNELNQKNDQNFLENQKNNKIDGQPLSNKSFSAHFPHYTIDGDKNFTNKHPN